MTEQPRESKLSSGLLAVAAILWAVGFLWYFFQLPLPNLSTVKAPIARGDIVAEIGRHWLTLLNPFDYSSRSAVDAGWEFLPQRFPFMGTAFLLWLCAWSLGRVACYWSLAESSLQKSERFVLDMGVGLSLFSLWVLTCGVCGWLSKFVLLAPSAIALCIAIWQGRQSSRRPQSKVEPEPRLPKSRNDRKLILLLSLMAAPFVWHILLGGMTPPFDFDVREYHLQGPKEWFLAGRITTLEHNVYTSFPFLSEMFSLAAMVLHQDWWQGAISGKLTLAGFQFLSAICAYAIGRRWMGVIPGMIAAVAVLSTPWTVRISIIAYAEGALTFYLTATVMAALLTVKTADKRTLFGLTALTGFLAGSAMAAKYPGVVSVVLPVGVFLHLQSRTTTADDSDSSKPPARAAQLLRVAVLFGLGVILAVGPWLIRNAAATGNPVYPLAYSVFGADDWSPEMDAKWKRAHSAPDHNIAAVPEHLIDVAARSDWQNGFLIAFAVPALLLAVRTPAIAWIGLNVAWMLVTWWALTHRIDRFWIPIIPLLAVLAGNAWNLTESRLWRFPVLFLLGLCCIFNYGFSRLDGIGFHVGLMDFRIAKQFPIRRDIKLMNETLPRGARVLMVGEAEVFDAEFDLIYNTVFDESIFEQWTSRNNQSSLPVRQREMRPPVEIHRLLNEHRITHVFVNWAEILRYRLTYGYTDYVTPQRFQTLEENGLLQPPVVMATGDWTLRSDAEQREVLSWDGGESLRVGPDGWTSMMLYRVRSE